MGAGRVAAQGTVDQPATFLMSVTVDQLRALGVSKSTVNRKLKTGEWKKYEPSIKTGIRGKQAILVSSLPTELQFKWLRLNVLQDNSEQTELSDLVVSDSTFNEQEIEIKKVLLRLSSEERVLWINEALRLAQIITRYSKITPKRHRISTTGEYEFVPEVYELCQQAVCADRKILSREPHRQSVPSPYTLDGWWHRYKKIGLLTFLRTPPSRTAAIVDKRRALISPSAVKWINTNWKQFHSPHHLFKALEEIAKLKGWKIPSESWFYRLWENVPEIVKVLLFEGPKTYESKLAPYVPRDFSDLSALQVLCGDHSQRDVTVLLPDGRTIARPWWTGWYDLRIGLIWGWHLSVELSSYAAGLAYADGVLNFGCQPPPRPEQNFYSYVYTDQGRTYKSHNWDGKVIAVHENAMRLNGCFEMLLTQRRVGILDELYLKHLLARGYNAKEKPIEEVNNVLSFWEQNNLAEYCGRSPEKRPERWRKLYAQHQRFLRGERDESPFIRFEEYRERLAQFIIKFNSSPHTRGTLGGRRVVPLDEYHRLYTTRYEISKETLSLLLMKAEKRVIGKNGVQMFRPNWFFMHESMALFKGMNVEVRYKDDNYNQVWVILPNNTICEAERIPTSSLLNPNKQALKMVAHARANEREVVRNFELITQSVIRGESTEDRVAKELEADSVTEAAATVTNKTQTTPAQVHQLTRFDCSKVKGIAKNVTGAEVAKTSADTSIFNVSEQRKIKEFDCDE